MLGELIRQKRKEKDITQAELARLIGTDITMISRWERDVVSPSAKYLTQLGSILDLAVPAVPDEPARPKPAQGMTFWGSVYDAAAAAIARGNKKEMRDIAYILSSALDDIDAALLEQ